MNSTDDKITHYYSLKPSQYGYLEMFKLHRDFHIDGCNDYSLELQMRSTLDGFDGKRLYLSFLGIKELKIGNIEGLLSLLINIRNVQEYQLEGIKYKVVENEYETFSFLCLDIEATVK